MILNNNFDTRNIKDYRYENDKYFYTFSDVIFKIINLNVDIIHIRLYEYETDDSIVCQDFIIQVKDEELKKWITMCEKYVIGKDKRYKEMIERIVYKIVQSKQVLELFNIYDTYLQLKKEMADDFYNVQVVI